MYNISKRPIKAMYALIIEDSVYLPGNTFTIDKKRVNMPDISELYEMAVFFKLPVETEDIGIRCVVREWGETTISLEGICRVRAKEPLKTNQGFVDVVDIPDVYEKNLINDGLMQGVKALVRLLLPRGSSVSRIKHPGQFTDMVASYLNLGLAEKTRLLNTPDSMTRLKLLFSFINKQGARTGSSLSLKTNNPFMEDIKDLEERIERTHLPEYVQTVVDKEMGKLKFIHPSSPEYSVCRGYVEFVLDMPWEKSTEDDIDIPRAKAILDRDHFDLTDVKERILEFLAVKKLNPAAKGSILCFSGPPGVGKTSLGKSIAEAMGRRYVRISLGGIRDEAEIRGHRRTYIGAMSGRVIKEIQRCGSNNPVFVLDEIDKVGKDFRGDPASALLEILDPEQNFSFKDNYLEIPFDLSNVMFIGTANTTETILPTLLDRMEVIEISGYTEEEKLQIAKLHLVPKKAKAVGFDRDNPVFTDSAIKTIISDYTMEAGVRGMEKKIEAIYRKLARKKASEEILPKKVDKAIVKDFLGPASRFRQNALEDDKVGISTGLAWTQSGGEILIIESSYSPGSGKLELTGNMGAIMQESARIALGYIKSNAGTLGIDIDFSKIDINIHVPMGAISKDGPSAGLAMLCALISLFTERPIRNDTAITGEVTLSGRILPVGGIKEKVLAGVRGNLKRIILPAKNRPDLERMSKDRFIAADIFYVDNVMDAFTLIFREPFEAIPIIPGNI